MKTYRVEFECKSRINKLPDAQTIFGVICSIYKNVYGDEKFNEYISSLKEGHPLFVHSSLFPEGLFLMIKESLFDVSLVNEQTLKSSPSEQIGVLSQLKKYKKISYIAEGIMKDYIFANKVDELKSEQLKNPDAFQIDGGILKRNNSQKNVYETKNILVTHARIDKLNIEGENRSLYYDQSIFHKQGQKFFMFVKTDLDMHKVEDVLKYIEYFPIGSKGSTGNNVFKYVEYKKYNYNNVNPNVVLLSKCLPMENEFDYDNSFYGVFSNQYHSSNEYKNYVIGKISKLVEGSLMAPIEKKEYYGQLLNVSNDENPLYHYGIGFVL